MKPKKCRICRVEFEPFTSLQKTCSIPCALAQVRQDKAKQFRKETRKMKERIKTKSDWLKEAQVEFNKFIRHRDKDQLCISCQKPPKKKNAGHYKSIGAFPELRFNENNCHLQCEHCNSFLSGNLANYRTHLLKKIGQRTLDFLEGHHQPQNLTIEDIKEIKQYYREQTKLLKVLDNGYIRI